MKLDAARVALLTSTAGWAVVQAFAGAGKTRLAIEIARRFRASPGLKIGQRILFISFSTASCFRAQESLRGSAIPSSDVEVCTFHSFALALVRRYAERLGVVGPIRTGPRATPSGTHLDFDDLLARARRLLDDADLADLLPDAYPLVIVDEFQDTSAALLDLLVAGFVGRSTVRCFGDSHQRIQPEALAFDAHPMAVGLGAEEHHITPISGYSRYKTHAIAELAQAFRDARPYSGDSDLVKLDAVGGENEQLAHCIHWDALKAVQANRKVAVLCFSNSAVGIVAALLRAPTEKRPHRLPLEIVTSKYITAAQDDLYIALLRHWTEPTEANATGVSAALALLTVGGNIGHKHYPGRLKKLDKARKDGTLPAFPVCSSSVLVHPEPAELLDAIAPVAAALGEAVVGIWKSTAWCMSGLASLAWRLSQSWPDGLALGHPEALERLAWAWDQARRWRSSNPGPIQVMTVNQSKNREFDDVFVYIDGFQTEVRGPISDLNRMQMYVAVSRARRSVKVIEAQTNQTKPSALLRRVMQ